MRPLTHRETRTTGTDAPINAVIGSFPTFATFPAPLPSMRTPATRAATSALRMSASAPAAIFTRCTLVSARLQVTFGPEVIADRYQTPRSSMIPAGPVSGEAKVENDVVCVFVTYR